jgi:hypothetical protein
MDADVHSHSRVPFPRDSRSNIALSNLRLPPTWSASSPYLYPPGTELPSYSPGFPFRRLLRLAGLRVVIFDMPPHEHELCSIIPPACNFSARQAQKTLFLIITSAGPPRKHHSSVAQSGHGLATGNFPLSFNGFVLVAT